MTEYIYKNHSIIARCREFY